MRSEGIFLFLLLRGREAKAGLLLLNVRVIAELVDIGKKRAEGKQDTPREWRLCRSLSSFVERDRGVGEAFQHDSGTQEKTGECFTKGRGKGRRIVLLLGKRREQEVRDKFPGRRKTLFSCFLFVELFPPLLFLSSPLFFFTSSPLFGESPGLCRPLAETACAKRLEVGTNNKTPEPTIKRATERGE